MLATFNRTTQRAVIISAMVALALGLWTVIPLAWLWIGSQMESGSQPSFAAYGVILSGIPLTVIILGKLLAVLDRRLDRLHGIQRKEDRAAWLRSMRDVPGSQHEVTTLDRIMITTLMVACCCMGVWFFFFAELKLPGG